MITEPTTPTTDLPAYDSPARGDEFRRELAAVLNRYSLENASDTPDFLLADYLIDCLRALDTAIRSRSRWYKRHDHPGGVDEEPR